MRFSKHLWLLALPLLLSSCNFSTESQLIEKHRSRAKKLYEQRDFGGAIEEYEEILRVNPKQNEAHYRIALIHDKNINDFLAAAYHYQRYLDSPNIDPNNSELAKRFLENAKMQLASTVPNAGNQNSPEIVKLRSENSALHRQVDDLKREIVRNRSKQIETKSVAKAAAPTKNSSEEVLKVASRSSSKKTYVVRSGDGIYAIAEKVYGSRSRWRDIVEANPSIKDPNRLSPGQVLVIP